MTAWSELERQFPVAQRTSRIVMPVDTYGKRLYRLRASGGEAAALCALMKSAGASCISIAEEGAGPPRLRKST